MEHIRQSIFAFLKNKNLKVLAITGDWGVGKTYFWKNDILNNIPIEDKKDYYSYVSLFNIETINDLKIKLYYESKPMLKEDSNIPQLSYTDTVYKSIEAIQKLQKVKIDNYLICFDDIERKSKNLDLKTFLGYVSELKEIYENKIVIIFNKNEIKDKQEHETLTEYKEKVFDMELIFNSSPEYNQDIIFKNHLYIREIKQSLKPMFVTNMRILNFIKNNIDYLTNYIAKENEHIKLEVLSKIIFITWIFYQKEQTFNIKDLEDFFGYYKPLSKDEEKIRNQIISYGYEYFEDFHKEIINYIINGYLNIKNFTQEIAKLSKQRLEEIEKETLDKEIKKIWSIFNSNFIARDYDFITAAEKLINQNIHIIPYDRLKKILDIIKKIEETHDIQQYIDKFITFHTSKFNLKDIDFFLTKTNSNTLIEELNQCKRNIELSKNLNLKSVIYKMIGTSGWTIEDEEYLDSHSAEDIYIWLKSEYDPDLLQTIRSSFSIFANYDEENKRKSFGQKLYAALVKIWREGTPIDKLRITACLGLQAPTEEEKADSHPPSPT